MSDRSASVKTQVVQSEWYRELSRYEKPHPGKALFQLFNTLLPYLGLWVLMVWMLHHGLSYGLLLPLMVVAAGLLVRIFIFFHDCSHGSFFASRKANRIVGYLCGILTFTPYENWRHPHVVHHATGGDLDRRGDGDVWTMTVQEFLAAPLWKQLLYRLFRNPLFLFVLSPLVKFAFVHRFPHVGAGKPERVSVHLTNLALLGVLLIAHFTIGIGTYLFIQVPIITLAGAVGIWLFYVQHQYEGVYWERHESWDPVQAALAGSSYYKLPKLLQWFSGNIGLHHIHHLRPRIPNYNLQRCLEEVPALQEVEPLTLRRSLKSMFLHLWDEQQHKLISFRALNRARTMLAN